MPYYVYAIKPMARLEQLAEFATFKEASAQAKVLRAEGSAARIKVMFADNPIAAEDLMLQVREAPPDGDD